MSTPVSATTAALEQPVGPRGPARLAHEDGARVRARRLRARLVDAVVADHRRREADELLREARVGDDLLVAGHRGREDGLAAREARPRRPTRPGTPCRPRAPASRSFVHHRAVRDRHRDAALERAPEEPRVRRARPEAVLRHPRDAGEVEQDDVRARAGGDPRPLEPEDARRPGRQALEQRLRA